MTIDHESADAKPTEGEKPESACKKLPPEDIYTDALKHSARTDDDPAWKQWSWGVIKRGDCTLQDGTLTIYADGTANFWGYVSSSSTDDEWVFLGGVSLVDVHRTVLWTSPKLIGPGMPGHNETAEWEEKFNYPANWFDSAAGANINGAHC